MKALQAEEETTVDLTPVIDCVFNLLIFFLVATKFEEEERELPIELPQAAQAQPLSMTPEIVVNINKEGHFIIEGRRYDEAQIFRVFTEAKSNNPRQAVLIRADGLTAWKFGVTIMGLCNKAKISDYKVAALQPEQP
jgi:biopolymer transport protein ExbD